MLDKSLACRAADVIRERGWMQGSLTVCAASDEDKYVKYGPVCLVGALYVAAGIDLSLIDESGLDDDSDVQNSLLAVRDEVATPLASFMKNTGLLEGQGSGPRPFLSDVTTWNDRPERTEKDVIAVLEAFCLS